MVKSSSKILFVPLVKCLFPVIVNFVVSSSRTTVLILSELSNADFIEDKMTSLSVEVVSFTFSISFNGKVDSTTKSLPSVEFPVILRDDCSVYPVCSIPLIPFNVHSVTDTYCSSSSVLIVSS